MRDHPEFYSRDVENRSKKIYTRSPRIQKNNFMPPNSFFSLGWIFSLPGSNKGPLTNGPGCIPTIDRKTDVFQL